MQRQDRMLWRYSGGCSNRLQYCIAITPGYSLNIGHLFGRIVQQILQIRIGIGGQTGIYRQLCNVCPTFRKTRRQTHLRKLS